jgi:hypothetical protein
MEKIIIQKALNWWNELPIQDICGNNGWANLVMFYYPNQGSCYGLTDEEILHMWQKEHPIEYRKLKISKIIKKYNHLYLSI